MKNNCKIKFIISGISFLLFCGLIFALKFIDVAAIGPNASSVGFASLNKAVHSFFGVNLGWYTVTEVLGYIAIAMAAFFAFLGLYQLINRKSLKKVDADLYVLAGCYASAVLIYVFFEHAIINYRPVLLDSVLEASFPSSHTVLSLCIMCTAAEQIIRRIKNCALKAVLSGGCGVLAAATVLGRLVSGVHWFTDILGGVLISMAIIFMYLAICEKVQKK